MAFPNAGKKGGRALPPNPWDPLVRVTHWAVAAAVIANGLFNQGGGTLHVWIGWGVMALLIVRLVWGVVGTEAARFSAFPPNPIAAIKHLVALARGSVSDYPSHNPAGALMVYALWASLTMIAVTGLVMTEGKSPVTIAEEKAAVAAGDWSVLVTDTDSTAQPSNDRWAKEVHEVLANLVLVLAALHVVGVGVEQRALRRSLIRPMLFGAKIREKRGP